MIITSAIVIFLCAFAFKGVWDIVNESDQDIIHRRQQEALRRHHKSMAKDCQRATGYWMERGKIIRPRVQE